MYLFLRISLIVLWGISLGIDVFAEKEEYRVGPGDSLDITVWNEPSLTKVFTVSKHGSLDLPLLGDVQVNGLTPREIADLIAQELKDGQYLIDPKVNVLVKRYGSKKIMLFGLVNKPGLHYLRGKTTVLEFLSEIGGLRPEAGTMIIHRKRISSIEEGEEIVASETAQVSKEKDNVVIVDLYALLIQGDLSQNIQILPGDLIYVGRGAQQIIYVLGEVKKPGPYAISKGLTVLGAIDRAGGFTEFAAQNRIKVFREENGEKKKIIVRLKEILKGDKSKDIKLKTGDVVVVPQSWF